MLHCFAADDALDTGWDTQLYVSPFNVQTRNTHVYANGYVCLDQHAQRALINDGNGGAIFWGSSFNVLPAWLAGRAAPVKTAPRSAQNPCSITETSVYMSNFTSYALQSNAAPVTLGRMVNTLMLATRRSKNANFHVSTPWYDGPAKAIEAYGLQIPDDVV